MSILGRESEGAGAGGRFDVATQQHDAHDISFGEEAGDVNAIVILSGPNGHPLKGGPLEIIRARSASE